MKNRIEAEILNTRNCTHALIHPAAEGDLTYLVLLFISEIEKNWKAISFGTISRVHEA